jgi:hypothetical protein
MKTRPTAFDAKPLFRPRLLDIFNQPYGRSDLLSDVMAGITVGLIALPLALALGIASIPSGTQTPYPHQRSDYLPRFLPVWPFPVSGEAACRSAVRLRHLYRLFC